MRTKLVFSIVVIGAVVALLYGARERMLAGSNDFVPLYVAAQLAGSGHLYDAQPYLDFQADRFGAAGESLRFTRLPFYAAILAPLGYLDYQVAHWLWTLLRVIAIAAFVLLWPVAPSRADTLLFVALSLPLYMALMTGQDAVLLLPLIAVALRCERSRPFLCGLLLSLCAIKFHLFTLLPLLLWAQRRWDIGKGFAAGGAALAGLSFVAGGWNWPVAYYLTLTDSRVHPDAAVMPNVHGIGMGIPMELALCALLAIGAWSVMRRVNFESGLAVALIGGLLASYHAYVMDTVILLPALLIVLVRAQEHWLKLAAALLLSPIAPLLLLSGRPRSYAVQVGLVIFLGALMRWGPPFGAKRARAERLGHADLATAHTRNQPIPGKPAA